MSAPSSPSPVLPHSRRWWLGAAAAAGLAGVGTALWRYEPKAVAPSALDALWALTLEDPTGAPLSLAAFRGRPLVINFWATWCPPCVEELPMLNAFFAQHRGKGWQVLGLAVDQPSAVRAFVQRLPLAFPVAMAGLGGTDLARSLGNATGGLPFTVVVSANGDISHRKLGKVTPEDLRQWAELV